MNLHWSQTSTANLKFRTAGKLYNYVSKEIQLVAILGRTGAILVFYWNLEIVSQTSAKFVECLKDQKMTGKLSAEVWANHNFRRQNPNDADLKDKLQGK